MLDKSIQTATQTTSMLVTTKKRARETVIGAIRRIEEQLIASLNGDRLRGVPSLTPRGAEEFRAVRVGTKRLYEELPLSQREVLVLLSTGHLAVARMASDGRGVIVRPTRDEELVAEDLTPFVLAITTTLERHMVMTTKRTDEISRIERFAQILTTSFNKWEGG